MRILIINPPHPSIGSRIPVEHLPPLGLLAIGGPLLDAGHEVKLLDAEFGPLSTEEIVEHARCYVPGAILVGHSGSTSAHPTVVAVTRALRERLPGVWIIYGGVFPTYHWREILEQEPQIDVIVRGEGEAIITRLIAALESDGDLATVPGLAFRDEDARTITATAPAPPIADLDAYRIGWELIDFSRYSYWNNKRAVVVQFSRGCPHHCSYCGQRFFWRRWRHRDPRKFAAELAWLHREHGVEVINFADENPTASRPVWKAFLEALIAENVPLILIGSTRASDIVRDADLLPLYQQAGVARFLLGIETTDAETLKKINKGTTTAKDREAIGLLRRHGIISLAAFVSGFEEETDADYWRALRQMLAYDPDQIQAIYATPHRWTPLFAAAANRRVIQGDLSKWDYKHQVLATRHLPSWRILLWVKLIEAVMQLRPKSLWRLLAHPEAAFRDAMRWYYHIGSQVWPYELWHFLFKDRRWKQGPTLAEFWNKPVRSPAFRRPERSAMGEVACPQPSR